MSFKEDWDQASTKERWNWTIQTTFIVIFGIIGVALAWTFANSSPRNYVLLIPVSMAVFTKIFISKVPWREPTNKNGSEGNGK